MNVWYLLAALLALLIVAGCTGEGPTPIPPETTAVPPATPDVPVATELPLETEPEATVTGTPQQNDVGWVADGIITPGEYPAEASYSAGKYVVYWKSDEDTLFMALQGAAAGWVAIGFEPTTAMQDADMIFGWVEDGETVIVDMFSTGPYGPHPPDTELGGASDIISFAGKEAGGTTVIEFSRLLDTGDAYDAPLAHGQTVRFIWGLASSDSASFKHNIAKGTGELLLS